ncbi:transcriptional protein SWT1-like [Lingula anatina]|uniref:Transcriptional protein SWT1 n=1 Tax=Lingula anatina TaxID=7574 RepID=A0A1S3JTZ8_LINAN|nr:transcriptional protein SWT1-like [Lingula anatina]|eukprot:XP_013413803.1 transcriptional protein SWT1-like [Lingula anatina]
MCLTLKTSMADRKAEEKSQEEATLPPGWVFKISNRHNRVYYFNIATGQSCWELPKEGKEKRAACSSHKFETIPGASSSTRPPETPVVDKLAQQHQKKKKRKKKKKPRSKAAQQTLQTSFDPCANTHAGQRNLLNTPQIVTRNRAHNEKRFESQAKKCPSVSKKEQGESTETGTKRHSSSTATSANDLDLINSLVVNKRLKTPHGCVSTKNDATANTSGTQRRKYSPTPLRGDVSSSSAGRIVSETPKNKGTWSLVAAEEQKVSDRSRRKSLMRALNISKPNLSNSSLEPVPNCSEQISESPGSDHVYRNKMHSQKSFTPNTKPYTKHRNQVRSETNRNEVTHPTLKRDISGKPYTVQPQSADTSSSFPKESTSLVPQPQQTEPSVPLGNPSPMSTSVKTNQMEIFTQSNVHMQDNLFTNRVQKVDAQCMQIPSHAVSPGNCPLNQMSPDINRCSTPEGRLPRGSSPFDLKSIVLYRQLPDSVDKAELYMVLDTNILLSHLEFVKEILAHLIPGIGRPVLVIPWVVIQELDYLKDNKKETNIKRKAYAAVKFLHESFKMKRPHLIGQTPQESSQDLQGFKIENNDDRLLQCCLQFRQKYPSSKIVVFSNDTNLCTKCMITGFPAFNRQGIVEGMQQENRGTPFDTGAAVEAEQLGPVNVASPHEVYTVPTTAPSSDKTQNCVEAVVEPKKKTRQELELELSEDVTQEVMLTLKDSLSMVLEKEMKEAFGDIWQEVVLRKPPWTLRDILECIDKHWMAVFGMFLNRQLSQVVKQLVQYFKSALGRNPSLNQVKTLMSDSLKFCKELRSKSDYEGKLTKTIQRLEQLSAVCSSVMSGAVEPCGLSQLEDQIKSHDTCLDDSNNGNYLKVPENDRQDVVLSQSVELMETLESTSEDTIDMPSQSSSVIHAHSAPSPTLQSVSVLDPESEQAIYFKFQSIWETIHEYSQTIETVLSGHPIPVPSPSTPSREQAVEMLKRLYTMSLELKMEFINFLSVPVPEANLHPEEFFSFCQVLNHFLDYLDIKKEAQGPDVHPEKLLLYFLNDSRREGMVNGLAQLSEMIHRMGNCGLNLQVH